MRVEQRPTRCTLIGMALLLLVLLAAWSQGALAQSCAADPAWVKTPSPPHFDRVPANLCDFYRYAWRSFLDLTSPVPGKHGTLKFETLSSVYAVEQGSGALNTKDANRLITGQTLFLDPRQHRTRVFQVRGLKPFTTQQAAATGTQGMLADQNRNLTYFEEFVSPIAEDFISSCHLNIAACQSETVTSALQFPAGAIEIKVSWRVLPAKGATNDTYYTLPGVPVYDPSTKATMVVNLGLAGFHLVFATKGHPEMVWATFEHIDNAPNGPCTGSTTNQVPKGFTGWAFNDAAAASCADVNVAASLTTPPTPSQVFRNYAYGSGTGSSTNNAATIEALNSSVGKHLTAKESVWRHYFLVGAVWTNGTLPAVPPVPAPASGTTANEVGSTFLANATMETFQQWPNPQPSSVPSSQHVNCFSCHNTNFNANKAPFSVSHVILPGRSAACPYSTALPKACTRTQTQTLAAHGSTP
jgi:hypothetical protein